MMEFISDSRNYGILQAWSSAILEVARRRVKLNPATEERKSDWKQPWRWAETVKKRRRATKKPYSRSIVGATLEVIQKKRTEKAEVRDAAREAALREIKERIKKTKNEKKAKKAEVTAKTQKTQTKASIHKAAKGPKLGGGGGNVEGSILSN